MATNLIPQDGDKLAIDADGEPSVDGGAGVLTSVRRWATGQGRVQSVVWLEGLADRVQVLAAQQMRAALEAEADAASARQSPDMCPQGSQATRSCPNVGILHAMTEDVGPGQSPHAPACTLQDGRKKTQPHTSWR